MIEGLRSCLLNLEEPIAKRTHAAFHLRTIGSEEAAMAICDGNIMQLRKAIVTFM